jgi:predicted flap endonuclease-1-like 5' DNA nuclease
MFSSLGLFDPGWRDFSVRSSNTEIALLWLLAGILGFLLYHYLIGRKAKMSKEAEIRLAHLEKDLHDERTRHHKVKHQLDAALSKANAFSSSASEMEKLKARIHDLQKESDLSRSVSDKLKADLASEHAKVTSMIVDHSDVEALRNRVRNQEKELNESRGQVQQLRTGLDQALNEKSRLAASMNESQLTDLRNKIQKLEGDLHSSRLMVVKFQTEASAVEEEKKRNSQSSLTNDERSRDTDALKSRIEKLEGELQKLRQANAGMDELRAQLEQAKAETRKWENEAEAQGRNAASALELEQTVSKLKAELQQIRTENQHLTSDLSAARSDDSAAADQAIALATTNKALQEAQSRISILESEQQSGMAASAQLASRIETLLQEKKRLENELNTVTSLPEPNDPLLKIEGIGPKIEELLNKGGIVSYRQLASASTERLQAILDDAGEQYRIHDPGTWPEQARLLAEGKLEAFEDLTLKLKGGKRV